MHYRLFAENRIHKFGLYQSKLMQGHTELYNSKTEISEITYINERNASYLSNLTLGWCILLKLSMINSLLITSHVWVFTFF